MEKGVIPMDSEKELQVEESTNACKRARLDLDVPSDQCQLTSPSSSNSMEGAIPKVDEPAVQLELPSPSIEDGSPDPRVGEDTPLCLLNEDILENIFKYLVGQPYSWINGELRRDVQSIRLVCKTWRDSATRLYRRTRNVSKFESYACRSSLKRLREFVNLMENSSAMIPIQKYKFVANYFEKDENYEVLKHFMRICGPEVVSLYFCFSDTYPENIDLNSLRDLNLGKLTKLQIYFSQYAESEAHGLVSFLEVILNGARALTDFNFEFSQHYYRKIRNVVLEKQFEDIISNGLSRTVKKLSLKMILHEATFISFMEKGVKLEHFEFGSYSVSESEIIRKFLASQSSTLKYLGVTKNTVKGGIPIEFPPLKQLEHLELGELKVEPFTFAETFPKLVSLNVLRWDNADTFAELLSFQTKVVKSLREIHLPDSGTKKLAKDVSNHFPNIRELYISLNSECEDIPETMEEVYIHFSDVEHLNIKMYLDKYLRLNGDSMFSGISDEDCRRILRRSNFENENRMELQRRPSILNLKNLKKLVVDHGPVRGRFILSDIWAHFVLLEMANLEELETSGANFSTKYYQLLEDKGIWIWRTRCGGCNDYSSHSSDENDSASSSSSDSS